MYDGEKRPLPCFHGVRGPEVVRSLLEIEATFEKNLQILKDVKKTILDVKVEKNQKLHDCMLNSNHFFPLSTIICRQVIFIHDYNGCIIILKFLKSFFLIFYLSGNNMA